MVGGGKIIKFNIKLRLKLYIVCHKYINLFIHVDQQILSRGVDYIL